MNFQGKNQFSNTKLEKAIIKIDAKNAKKINACPCCKSTNFKVLADLPKFVCSKFYEITYEIDLQLIECNKCSLFFKSHSIDHMVDKTIYRAFNINAGKRWAQKIPKAFLKDLKIINECERVLEIGPGETPASDYFKKPIFFSLEMDQNHILKSSKEKTLQFQGFIDRELDALDGQKFDAVLAFDLFEHVDDVEKMFENLGNLLRPGGKVIFETGNCDSKPANFFKENWKYYNIPEHRVFFCERFIRKLCKSKNFTPIQIKFTPHKSVRSVTGFGKKFLATLKYIFLNRTISSNKKDGLFIGPEFPFFKDHIFCILRKEI